MAVATTVKRARAIAGATVKALAARGGRKALETARAVVMPERCKPCGALFTARDIAYNAWAHGECKRCHAKAERRTLAGVGRYIRKQPIGYMNRATRRALA